jgi:hypothetical protein
MEKPTAAKKAAPKKPARPAQKPSPTAQARRAAATAKRVVEAEEAERASQAVRASQTERQRSAKSEVVLDDLLLEQLDAVLAELDPPQATVLPAAVPQRAARPPAETAAGNRPPLWARLVADPGYASEHLAREAVRRLGPEAADWTARMRRRYPTATSDGLARLATTKLVRTARRQGAGAIFGGAAGAGAALAVLARTHVRLVLTVAAVYDLDPTAEARGREVLDLLRMPRLTQPGMVAGLNGARLVGALAARRLAARTVPFGAAVAGAIHSGRSTEALALRAVRAYRNGSLPWSRV